MSSVTIGDQKFIKDREKGWIDVKTKQPADKGLIKLLDSLVVDEPEIKKLRVKLDKRVEPIFINGQKFVYDVNQGWLDDKTKVRAPDSLQRTLSNTVPRFGKDDTADIDLSAGFGMAAQAGLEKTKEKEPKQKKSGDGKLVTNRNAAINKPLIAMINQLASIDSYLKQQLQNKQIIASKQLADAKEANIEAKTSDAAENIEDAVKPDATPEKSKLAMLGGAAGLAALIALQFDPVKASISQMVDFGRSVVTFVNDVAKTINSAFDWLLGGSTTGGGGAPSQSQDKSTDTPTLKPNAGTPKPVNDKTWMDALSKQQNVKKPSLITPAPTADKTPAKPNASPAPAPAPAVPMSPLKPTNEKPKNAAPAVSNAKPPAQNVGVPNRTWAAALSKKPTLMASNKPQTHGLKEKGGRTSGKAATPMDTVPKGDIAALGRYLQGQGLRISGHSQFGGQELGQHSANSRHYKDMAIDVNVGTGLEEANDPAAGARFDALQQQLDAAGYNVIWRKAGHYNHMHVSVGGPEGIGGGESPIAPMVDAVTNAVDMAKTLFKKGGAALIGAENYKPRDYNEVISPRTGQFDKVLKENAMQKTAIMAESRTPPPVPTIKKPSSAPNINPDKSSPVIQTPATESDMSGVNYYLQRFGFNPAESEVASR